MKNPCDSNPHGTEQGCEDVSRRMPTSTHANMIAGHPCMHCGQTPTCVSFVSFRMSAWKGLPDTNI